MPEVTYIQKNGQLIPLNNVAAAPITNTFISGVTMPFYDINTGEKNIGNLPGVTLDVYNNDPGDGVLQINGGTYTNVNFGNRILDIRASTTFNNCRIALTNNTDTTIKQAIRILNGGANLVTFNDCEIHNYDQYIRDGFQGRNAVFNRCIVSGFVDGIDSATSGAAPQGFSPIINDSWIGNLAWWYSPTAAVVHSSDYQTHNDCSQVQMPGMEWHNVFFGIWPSELVGTGTPGSGSDTGNTHATAYRYTQAQSESYRTTFLNKLSAANQSFDTVPRKSSTGGSWAGIMGNTGGGTTLNLVVDHCWFSGGTVQINVSDDNLTGTVASVKRSTFWNDMSGGHSLPYTAKGVAVYCKTGVTIDMPTTGSDKNLWFDGSIVSPNYA